jgi:hypothetical protein
MRPIGLFLGFLILVSLLMFPASALITNNTQNSQWTSSTLMESASFNHDPGYIPVGYEYLFIIIGGFCLVASKVIRTASSEVIFSLLSVVPLGAAGWYANYMTIENVSYSVVSGTVIMSHSQIITPSPALSYIMYFAFVLSIANAIYILFFEDRSEKTGEQKGQPKES